MFFCSVGTTLGLVGCRRIIRPPARPSERPPLLRPAAWEQTASWKWHISIRKWMRKCYGGGSRACASLIYSKRSNLGKTPPLPPQAYLLHILPAFASQRKKIKNCAANSLFEHESAVNMRHRGAKSLSRTVTQAVAKTHLVR